MSDELVVWPERYIEMIEMILKSKDANESEVQGSAHMQMHEKIEKKNAREQLKRDSKFEYKPNNK